VVTSFTHAGMDGQEPWLTGGGEGSSGLWETLQVWEPAKTQGGGKSSGEQLATGVGTRGTPREASLKGMRKTLASVRAVHTKKRKKKTVLGPRPERERVGSIAAGRGATKGKQG